MNQLTMAAGAIGVARSDLITGPFPPSQISQSLQGIVQVGVNGNDAATFILCNPIFDGDDSSNIPDRIGNHVPTSGWQFLQPGGQLLPTAKP